MVTPSGQYAEVHAATPERVNPCSLTMDGLSTLLPQCVTRDGRTPWLGRFDQPVWTIILLSHQEAMPLNSGMDTTLHGSSQTLLSGASRSIGT